MIQSAAFGYCALCLVVVGFQLCMIAGAPWGRLTQGGAHPGTLPISGRIAAGFSIVLMLVMAASILSAAGFAPNWPTWTGWATLGVTVLSVIMNLITPSKPERMVWGPVTILMLALALVVMLSV